MNHELSDNTKAILLLVAPLLVGRKVEAVRPLTLGEYNKVVRCLRTLGKEPADMLKAGASGLVRECAQALSSRHKKEDDGNEARLHALLGRDFQLGNVLNRWQERGIWVISRADADYPQRLKQRLKENAPPVLYGAGNRRELNSGGLAVVGSRHVDDKLKEYASNIGCLCAAAGKAIVSGGARGIDEAAMRGALEAGGKSTGILANNLERAILHYRKFLAQGQMVLISPYDPAARFNVGNAMQRNKYIYALSDAALVVSCDYGKGGTWNGAVELLEKLRFVPLYVRNDGDPGAGIEALVEKGAKPWPEPDKAEELLKHLPSLGHDAQSPGNSPVASGAVQLQLEFDTPSTVPEK